MIVRMLEKGWFSAGEKNAVHSAYLSNFADVVTLFAIENANR